MYISLSFLAVALLMARKDCHLDALIITLLITITVSLFILTQNVDSQTDDITKEITKAKTRGCSCANVFEYGVKGKWVKKEQKMLSSYSITDKEIRKALYLPEEMHRDDLRYV